MSAGPIQINSGQPEIPLSVELRTAYEELDAQYEDAIENTSDPALHASLLASQDAVGQVISLDNDARIKQNTDAFSALLGQMNVTNQGLSDLKDQIDRVTGHIAMFAGIVNGINKVLSLFPGI